MKNKNKNKKVEENKDKGPEIKVGNEKIKPIKIERKPAFNGPVKINWKTFTKCLKEKDSKEQIIQDIISDYKKKKEGNAMKKVYTELKKENPIIIDCLNNQEHLIKE